MTKMKNKKGFVVYKEWTPFFKDLSADQSGLLIQALYAWFSGMNYEINDPLLKAIFEAMLLHQIEVVEDDGE